MNFVTIVGRLVSDPEVKELESGKKVSNITLAVKRSYKNPEGIYETDFIDCTLWNGVAEHTAEYTKKGDLISVKGMLETNIFKNKDGNNQKEMHVNAEKIAFLSSQSEKINAEINKDEMDME